MPTICKRCGGTGHEIDQRLTRTTLAAFRISRGLSQSEIAQRMGVTRAWVTQLESGIAKWTPNQIRKYRKALDEGSVE